MVTSVSASSSVNDCRPSYDNLSEIILENSRKTQVNFNAVPLSPTQRFERYDGNDTKDHVGGAAEAEVIHGKRKSGGALNNHITEVEGYSDGCTQHGP